MNKLEKVPPFHAFPHVHTVAAYKKSLSHFEDYFQPGEYKFIGSVKLHGTNCGINISEDGSLSAQSRNRAITPEDDSYGFASWVTNLPDKTKAALAELRQAHDVVLVYGEWIGKGIQAKVAISSLDRRFVPFAVRTSDDKLVSITQCEFSFPWETVLRADVHVASFSIEADMPLERSFGKAFGKMNEAAEKVGLLCPFGTSFGVEGFGEGIVWRLEPLPEALKASEWLCKTKSDHHKTKASDKVQKASVAEEAIEKLYDTCNGYMRVLQGIEMLREIHGIEHAQFSDIGCFAKWYNADIVREHEDDIEMIAQQEGESEIKSLLKRLTAKAIAQFKVEISK